LRFPEFSGEWKEVKLYDVGAFVTDRISSNKLTSSTYVSTENLQQNYGGKLDALNVPNNQNVIRYKTADILLSNIRPYLKKIWKADNNGGCSADVLVLRAKSSDCTPEFLYYTIANDKFITYVMSGAKGAKMPRGDKQHIQNYTTSIPSLPEQNKIYQLLHLLDERIATQKKVIERLETLINGIRLTMFNRLRMTEKSVKLGDIADIYQPQTISIADLTEAGKYLVFGANGIIGKYDMYNHEHPQICITCRGNTCGTVNYTQPFSWITGNAMVINVDMKAYMVNKRFLFHQLSSINFNSIISGSGQPQIVRQPLVSHKVILPSILCQNKIAKTLDLLIGKVEIEQSVMRQLESQKLYLLSAMFK
jgi:type I restriction enzyme S subunit